MVSAVQACSRSPDKGSSKQPTSPVPSLSDLPAMERIQTTEQLEPVFRDLSNEESEALLERNTVGRVAFSFRDSVDIRPIHYVYSKGWLFGRTSAGDKLTTLRHHQWVAFEVDEIQGPLNWQSVVVRGSFYRLEREGSAHDVRLYDRALAAVRSLSPDALTDRDPMAFRAEVFGVSIDSMSGRCCSTTE